ncbi:MAG: DUF1573 domain-containing protein [Bacteroidia bacterium]
MKKFRYSFLAVVAIMAFAACQTSGSTEEKTTADGNSAVQVSPDGQNLAAQNADPATTPKVPDFQAKAEEMAKTTVEFASEEYNYGQVQAGTNVTHQFKFKNTGTEPLVLTRVKASCGCTTPSYSKDPIPPGQEGFIDVVFNSAGKSGVQNKTVTVTGNFEGSINKILRISGEVLAAAN